MLRVIIGSDIEIMSSDAAQSVLIPHISKDIIPKMSRWEIAARTNNKSFSKSSYLEHLKKNFRNFTKNEFELIKVSVYEAKRLLSATKLLQIPFKFAILSGQIDWGYTYTIKDTIVLRDNDMLRTRESLTDLIIHEYSHVYQRMYPDTIMSLYNDWGFKKHHSINSLPSEGTVVNPDGLDYWSFLSTTGKRYICILLGNDNGVFDAYAYNIIDNNITTDRFLLNEEVKLSEKFFNVHQLYHPNEIMASLMPLFLRKKLIPENNEQVQTLNSLRLWVMN